MCVCVYIYIYVCVCVYTYIYIHTHTHTHMYIYTHTYIIHLFVISCLFALTYLTHLLSCPYCKMHVYVYGQMTHKWLLML